MRAKLSRRLSIATSQKDMTDTNRELSFSAASATRRAVGPRLSSRSSSQISTWVSNECIFNKMLALERPTLRPEER